VPGDHGAHGVFDERAKDCSPQLWTSEHRALVAIGVAALGIAGLVAFFKNKRH
jgi:LPXTG-motif cell wall-anchored protein